ncbi:hypothetical protein LCGC14_1922560, partial [marine sediment metagenome]
MRNAMILALVLAVSATAWADWFPGDDFKMHWPQMPDPNGWDVNFIQPKVLADDWECTEDGPVSDVHFWMSSRMDEPFILLSVHLSIHTDDLSNPDYSQPGNLLWEADFDPSMFTVNPYGTGQQGWYDPNPPEQVYPGDHFMFYQVNIPRIPDPWIQEKGTIYWLDISVVGIGPLGLAQLGWKTSLDHFRDNAVWADDTGGAIAQWQPLTDPFSG